MKIRVRGGSASERRQPPAGVIQHSDRGVQSLCEDYVALLKQQGLQLSCSRKGNPYDPALLESFMKTLKDTEVYMWAYETILDVIERVPSFLAAVYNKKRVQSRLDYVAPDPFETQMGVNCKINTGDSRTTLTLYGSSTPIKRPQSKPSLP